jgi:uncharacterized protein
MPTVSRFSLTPVNATALHHPQSIRLERYGAVGDRWFYFAKPDGRFVAGAAHGPLVQIHAEYDVGAERLSLAFPDGTRVSGDACALGEPVWTSMWGRSLTGRVVNGSFEEAVTAYVGERLRLVRTDEPGGAIDIDPVTLVSTASVEEFAAMSGDPRGKDARRFRLLIQVDGTEAREEHSWNSRRLRVGDAIVEGGGPVPRCIVTTQDPDTGRRDIDTLRILAHYRGKPDGKHVEFGMYGRVVEPGDVAVGDPVELLN